jgi:hypothetical protein
LEAELLEEKEPLLFLSSEFFLLGWVSPFFSSFWCGFPAIFLGSHMLYYFSFLVKKLAKQQPILDCFTLFEKCLKMNVELF